MIASAGIELEDVGSALTWGAFSSLISNGGYDSALWRSAHPDMADWASPLRTNLLLADIYDLLSQINANMVGGFSRKRAPRTKPYPRPWKQNDRKKIGKGAVPREALHQWIEEKRRAANG